MSELEDARQEVEAAIARWAQAWAADRDERRDEDDVELGQVLVTALVWGAEMSSMSQEMNGYAARTVGAPSTQPVSASAGLGAYIEGRFL